MPYLTFGFEIFSFGRKQIFYGLEKSFFGLVVLNKHGNLFALVVSGKNTQFNVHILYLIQSRFRLCTEFIDFRIVISSQLHFPFADTFRR